MSEEVVAPDMPMAMEAVQELQSEPKALPEPEVDKAPVEALDFDKALLQEVENSETIDTLAELPSESTDTENPNDQGDLDKTTEDDSSDLTNSRKSRELKSILALSKEANLDTNLSRKRKPLEGLKPKETAKITQPESEVKKPVKLTHGHNFTFPVTAEAELEQECQESVIKSSPGDNSINPSKLKRKRDSLGEAIVGGATEDGHRKNRKRSARELKMFKLNKDIFCWRCHREGVNVVCETCPRSYHQRCLKQTISDEEHWPCPECVAILKAESTHTRSEAMKGMSLEHLCSLLKFALTRMMVCQGSEPFLQPVSDAEFPDYRKYIIQPMDLTKLQNNIKANYYGSTQAFEADAKWILHNSIIFNSYQSKLTSSAKNIIKICKQEMAEIENCPSCYLNANTKKATWFVEVCPRPHLLVWAKLKGFPYWPAKAMSTTSSGMVDVRFFGAHDRAWVNYKDCYLYSEKDPNTFKQKRCDIEKCVEELNIYIDNLKKAYGEFRHAPYRTPLDPHNMGKQMLISIPKCKSLAKHRKSLKTSENSPPDEIKTELNPEGIALPDKSAPVEEKTLQQSSAEDTEMDINVEHDEEIRQESAKKDYPISEPYSNRTTPAHELDSTMEGYGTDDESVSDIDLGRRKAFASKIGTKVDDEDDDDTDTQVPSNIPVVDSASRGTLKTRGGSAGTPGGKSKVLQRRKSEVESPHKRISSEEISPGHRKTSRRNSDLSVKSDSSRLSNFSDKINRVDISENMEINLGNEDITISDNVSPPNGETSKSSSECSFEHKRKPVQVDIDNAEFSISPNKPKISDQLMKRLSDSNDKIQEAKKSVFDSKSPTEKEFQVVFGEQVEDSSRRSTSNGTNQGHSSFDHQKIEKHGTEDRIPVKEITESAEAVQNGNDVPEKEVSDVVPELRGEAIAEEEPILDAAQGKHCLGSKEPEKEVIKNKASDVSDKTSNLSSKKTIQPAITEFTTNISKPTTEKLVTDANSQLGPELVVNIVDAFEEDEEERKEKELVHNLQIDKKDIFNIIHSSLNRGKNKLKSGREIAHKSKHDTLQAKLQNTSKTHTRIETSIQSAIKSQIAMTSKAEASKTDVEPATTKSEIHTSTLSSPKEALETNVEPAATKSEVAKSDEPSKSDSEAPKTDAPKTDAKPAAAKSYGPMKPKDSKTMDDTREHAVKSKETRKSESSSSSDSAVKPKDPQKVDAKSHKPAVAKQESAIKSKHIPKSSTVDDNAAKSPEAKVKPGPPGQKRRSSEEAPAIPPKVIKLVSIDSILKQKGQESPILPPRMTEKSPVPNEIVAEPVKSEPESDDDFSENENLEAKRQYLSALNISEKVGGPDANKAPEIRTRAKAEERREKYRKVDNLTKVIDDVALNYTPEGAGPKTLPKKLERRKSLAGSAPAAEGEIYVKSFAKLQTASGKQRARKTFPTPSYVRPPYRIVVAPKKDASNPKKDNPTPVVITKKDVAGFATAKKPAAVTTAPSSTPASKTSVASTASTKNAQASLGSGLPDTAGLNPNPVGAGESSAPTSAVNLAQALKPVESAMTNMTHVILMPTPTINYCTPMGNPFMNTQVAMALPTTTNHVPAPPLQQSTLQQSTLQQSTLQQPPLQQSPLQQSPLQQSMLRPPAPNIRTSQNYVPQGDVYGIESAPEYRALSPGNVLADLLNRVAPEQPDQGENADSGENASAAVVETVQEDEFAVLNALVPDSVSRAVSDLLLRPPPRLRPRPPGMLSSSFDEGVPSTAGDVTARVNSIAHRMTDYFRGMLIETMADLGRVANPEAKIVSLLAEIEAMKHKHNLELSEMRQNICTILKDVQRSIVEDRERVKDESRASCEAETIKRIELAKSKQWCANCSKEAQFYCCWNTSYCDYPCQQKHWAQHMGKCTQNIEKSNNSAPSMSRPPAGQPIILRPTAPPKPGVGRIMAKPTKVYMNRATTPQKVFKTVAAPGNHITVIETTPGNYELVGNGPMSGPGGPKFYSMGPNVFTKLKGAASTPAAAAASSTTGSGAAEASRSPQCASRGPYAMPVATVLEED